MKSIFILLVVILVDFAAGAQLKTDLKSVDLKGKVKSMALLENYRYKKDAVYTAWEILYNKKYLFDNAGRYADYSELKNDGTLSYKIKYTYKAKDNKMELVYFDSDEKPSIKKA